MDSCNGDRENARPLVIIDLEQSIRSGKISSSVERQDAEVFDCRTLPSINRSPWCPRREQQESARYSEEKRGNRAWGMRSRHPQTIKYPESGKANARRAPDAPYIGHQQSRKRERQAQKKVD